MMKRILCLAAALLPLVCMAQENPIATLSQQPGLCSIIHRWGFVGDSLCSGEHEYTRADGTWLIDLEKYGQDFSDPELQSRYFLMGHMNAAGYQLMAWTFMTYIDWIIGHNMEAFSDIALM